MGYEIVYCASCSMQVRGADLEKHAAIRVDDQAYCAKCAPGVLKTLTPEKADEVLGRVPPPIRHGSTSRIAKVQTKSSGRLKAQPSAPVPIVPAPRPAAPNRTILIAAAAGVAVLVLVIVVLLSRDSAPEPRERRVETPPPRQAERPKPADHLAAAKALIDLEQLAASGADPLEILIRCDEIKGLVRGRPQEAKWREIQDRATEAKKVKDSDQAITRGLDQVRSLRKFDVRFDRKAEIRSLLERMRGLGGPRQGEVQQMADDYDRDLAAAVKRFRDLVAWYRFTMVERLGADDSGRENHAISMSGVAWNGSSVDAGPGARFSAGGIAIPVAVRDDFTIALWVRTRQGPSGNTQWFEAPGLVDAESPGVTDDFGTAVFKGRFALGVGKPDLTLSSRSEINDGRWHHVAATRSSGSGELKVYVDGVLEGTAAGPKGPRTAPNRMTIGQIQTGTNPFSGDLDDVRIYSRVLPDSEVAALARRPEGR